MTASDVRAHFRPLASAPSSETGTWKNDVATTGEQALVWTANDAHAEVERVSFEFHNGILVAIRADESAAASEARDRKTRTSSVTLRTVVAPAELTILARDCPTHAAEVAALLKTNPP